MSSHIFRRRNRSPSDIATLLGVNPTSSPTLGQGNDNNGPYVSIEFPGISLQASQLTRLRKLASDMGWGEEE
jgi:hypothetical protein